MILDVHVAYLIASLSVLFGLTYSIGQFLEYKMEQLRKARVVTDESEQQEAEILAS